MPDLEDQLRTSYEATTEPVDVDTVTVDPGTVIVGPFPEAAQRRSAMTAPTKPRQTQPWWRNAWVAAAAFVVVVVVGYGVLAAVTHDDERSANPVAQQQSSMTATVPPPSTSSTSSESLPTPEEVARSFIEARDSWDAAATQDLVAPDAEVNDLEVRTVADCPAQYRWYEAVDWRWTVGTCVETSSGPTAGVTCIYTHHNAWMDALGHSQQTGSYEFVIVDGMITELTNSFNAFGAWDAFQAWVSSNHPDDLWVMYDLSGPFAAPHYTDESLVLWEQHTAAFVEEQSG